MSKRQLAEGQATVSVVMPRTLRDELHVVADEEGRSLSGHVRWLIVQSLKERKA